mmetsp:Transcript_21369/g.48115  ORF Transcript_21369/g.48115 Transcript_21369/m.48115 type:complete len:129 (-) Transcript_21369:22-408(-)
MGQARCDPPTESIVDAIMIDAVDASMMLIRYRCVIDAFMMDADGIGWGGEERNRTEVGRATARLGHGMAIEENSQSQKKGRAQCAQPELSRTPLPSRLLRCSCCPYLILLCATIGVLHKRSLSLAEWL